MNLFESPGSLIPQDRDLRRILSLRARHARAGELPVDPERLAGLGRELLQREQEGSLVLTSAFLACVQSRAHALRQAALLRAAAELALARQPLERVLTAPAGPPLRLEDWLRRVGEELDRVLREGLPLCGVLLGCALEAPSEWPAALTIARAAVALDPGAESRLLLARVRGAVGDGFRAEQGLRGLLQTCDLVGLRASVHEALGCALERRGVRDGDELLSEACVSFERAGHCGAGARAELAGLGLALALDEGARVRTLADRLEPMLERPCVLQRAARELRLRWELAGSLPQWRARALKSRAWSELALEAPELRRRVAHDVLDAEVDR